MYEFDLACCKKFYELISWRIFHLENGVFGIFNWVSEFQNFKRIFAVADGLKSLARADDVDQVRTVAEYYTDYKACFEGTGNNPGEKTLEDKFFEYEVRGDNNYLYKHGFIIKRIEQIDKEQVSFSWRHTWHILVQVLLITWWF